MLWTPTLEAIGTVTNESGRRLPPCFGLVELFFGPGGDGRYEDDREEREQRAKAICFECEYRMSCLERALVLNMEDGVWGGMAEGERRKFRRHLQAEGYSIREVPEGDEFWASLNSFYREIERRRKEAS